jgi:phosphate uptake regulator
MIGEGDTAPPATLYIMIHPGAPPEHTFRRLIGGYLGGATKVEVSASKEFDADIRHALKEFRRRTSKLEVVSEQPNSQTMQDIERGDQLGIPQLVRRMFQLTLDIQREAAASWFPREGTPPRSLVYVDDEVDKVAWRVQRTLLRTLLLDPTKATMAPSAAEEVFFLMIARSLERISDHAAKLAEEGGQLATAAPPANVLKAISDLHRQVLGMLEASEDLVENPDSDRANEIIDTADAVHSGKAVLMERFFVPKQGVHLSPRILVSATLILDSIDRIASYVADIAEVAIDREAFGIITGGHHSKRAPPIISQATKRESKKKEKVKEE